MRRALYVLFLPLLMSCSLMPDEWYEDSQGFRNNVKSARSYSILPPPQEEHLSKETIYQNNYVLNETYVAKIGEPVLRVQAFKKDTFFIPEMMLETPVTAAISTLNVTLPAKKYPIFGIFEKDMETFYVLPKVGPFYFLVNMRGELQRQFLYEMKNSDKVTQFNDSAKFTPSSPKLKMMTRSRQEEVPFLDFEVVYDGIKNNQIVLFYKNSVPGTNGNSGSFETLAYPKDSTMISVEGRLLRILRADNEQISFIVIRD